MPQAAARAAAWALALALPLVALCGPARAWGNLLLIESPPQATTVALGPSVWQLPRYPGARRSETTLLPGIDTYAAAGWFVSTDSGVGWNLSPRKDLQGGFRLWPQFGRRRADAPAGIDAIGARLQGQAFLNYAPWPVLLLQSALLRGAGRHHDGSQLELGLTSGLPLGTDLLGIGIAANFANGAYRQSYFGVAATESVASGLPAYRMGTGWQDLSLTLSAEHRWSGPWQAWHLSGQLIAVRLLGAAARSPLTLSARPLIGTLTLWRDL